MTVQVALVGPNLRACAGYGYETGMFALINPVTRAEAFDHPDRLFEAKFDGFRAVADTARDRLISRNGNRTRRFSEVYRGGRRVSASKGKGEEPAAAGSLSMAEATRRKEILILQQRQLEFDLLRAQYIEADVAERSKAEAYAFVRDTFLALPAQLADKAVSRPLPQRPRR